MKDKRSLRKREEILKRMDKAGKQASIAGQKLREVFLETEGS